MKKKIIKNTLIAGAAGVGALAAIGNYFVNLYLSRDGIKKLQNGPGMLDEATKKILHESPESVDSVEFYRTTPHKKIFTFNKDSKCLHAIQYESDSDIYVIFCHGFTGDPNTDNVFAKRYYEMGYNVVMPYSRAHGKSEHNYCTMGWFERFDIIDWAKYIADKNPDAKIVLHGVSMGSATVMMATGEILPSNVKCCIADCGYTSLWEQYSINIRNMIHGAPAELLLHAANIVSKHKIGFDFKDASAVEQVKKSVTPTLFIHGDKDDFVPFWMNYTLYSAANCEKQRLVVPDSPHAVSELVNPELYWSTVSEFIDKYTKQ